MYSSTRDNNANENHRVLEESSQLQASRRVLPAPQVLVTLGESVNVDDK